MKKISNYKKYFFLIIIIFIFSVILSKKSFPVEPEEFLQDPQFELRARNISKNIRCLVCQNQSIDESSALLAKDLRILIRNKVTEGHTDKEIYSLLTDRYGDFILLNPPFKPRTFLLWFLPVVFFIIVILVIYWHNRKSSKV